MIAQPSTLAARADLLARGVRVLKPAGPGPFPVALQLHGCAGSQPFQNSYAEAAVKAGVAVVIVDSFKPRGMSRLDGSLFVCTGTVLRGAQRAGDLYAMLHWLKSQPWADAGRVVAAGWSHGGWTIMDGFAQGDGAARMTGLSDADPALLQAVKGAFLVYPYASFPSLTSARGWPGHRPKVFAVLGGKDAVVGTTGPMKALNRLKADGLQVDVQTFPDATHAFDDDDANDPAPATARTCARRPSSTMCGRCAARSVDPPPLRGEDGRSVYPSAVLPAAGRTAMSRRRKTMAALGGTGALPSAP